MKTHDVTKACAALVKAGKKPTVGLVRATLMNQVPLAAVVKGIQQFQMNRNLGFAMDSEALPEVARADKNLSGDEAHSQNIPSCSCEQRVLHLEQQLEKLNKQLKDLHTLVMDLSQS